MIMLKEEVHSTMIFIIKNSKDEKMLLPNYNDFQKIFKVKEILKTILSFSSGFDLLNWAFVSKSWNKIIKFYKYWDTLYRSLEFN